MVMSMPVITIHVGRLLRMIGLVGGKAGISRVKGWEGPLVSTQCQYCLYDIKYKAH
jgi:hypothetical protein